MRARFAFFPWPNTLPTCKTIDIACEATLYSGLVLSYTPFHPGKADPLRNQEQRAKRELHGSEKKKAASLLSSIETRRVHLLPASGGQTSEQESSSRNSAVMRGRGRT